MNLSNIWLPILLVVLPAAGTAAEYRTPEPGDPLRKEMLDVFRPEVEKELEQKVVFKVVDLRVTDDAAFLTAQPLKPDGTAIDYSETKFQEDIEIGLFDDWLCALAKREGEKWKVVALVIGATDVPFVEWHEEFDVPRGLIVGEE